MRVQNVGLNQGFSGKRDNINAFVNMNDKDLMNLSTEVVMNDKALMKKTKKHERLNKALTVALPVAFGLEFATQAEKGTRLGLFKEAAASSALMLIGIDAAFGVNRFLRNKSEKYRNFTDNHKFLSASVTLPLSVLAGFGTVKGGKALAGKFTTTKAYDKIASKLKSAFNGLKTKSTYTKVNDKLAEMEAKTPSALKSVAKFGAKLSPLIVVLATIFNSMKNVTNISNSITKEYISLKDEQLNLAKAMNRELSLQNDFLKTNPQNDEELRTVGMD